MPEAVKVDLGYAVLCAERNADTAYPEISVWLEDFNGVWMQDLVIVGGQYHYDNDQVVCDEGVSVKVYSDEDCEDFTHEFNVGVHHESDNGGALL